MSYKEEYNLNANSAFPVEDLSAGMTLLDYFAAKAMNDVMSKNKNINYVDIGGVRGIAHHSYRIAAAMMEERKSYLEKQPC